jgi:hypothetical protein
MAPDMHMNVEKPTYNETNFEHIASAVSVSVASVLTATLAPTTSPTPAPTVQDYQWVSVQKEVVFLALALRLPVSKAVASTPVMQGVFVSGYAAALGIPESYVAIASIDGEPLAVSASRRLRSSRRLLEASDVSITFRIQSNTSDETALAALESNAVQAATEGSLAANIQDQAEERGVLVASIQTMTRQLSAPVVERSDPVLIDTLVMLRRNTAVPTTSPSVHVGAATIAPTFAPSGGTKQTVGKGKVLAIVNCVIIAVMAAGFYIKSLRSKQAKSSVKENDIALDKVVALRSLGSSKEIYMVSDPIDSNELHTSLSVQTTDV